MRGIKCLLLYSALLLFPVFCSGQSSPKLTTCVENSGAPCPEWLHKLIGQYPPKPDLPTPAEAARYRDAGFFTVRKHLDGPALRPNRKSWAIFVATHAAAFTATAIAVHDPNSGEHADEFAAVGALTGLDFVLFKTFAPFAGCLTPGYEIYHYGKAATK